MERRRVRTRDEEGLHRSSRVSEASVASWIETKKLLPAGQIGERSPSLRSSCSGEMEMMFRRTSTPCERRR